MMIRGFVPARGGSVRVPRKNLRVVGGMPLVARAVATLRSAGVEHVEVSTDDDEIAAVASLWGAGVHGRPAALADDRATVDDVVRMWAATLPLDDVVVCLQPTYPFVTPESVMQMIDHQAKVGGAVLGMARAHHLYWSHDGFPLSARINSTTPPTEGQMVVMRECGVWVATVSDLLAAPFDMMGGKIHQAILDDDETIDIDTHADLMRARAEIDDRDIWIVYTHGPEIGTGHHHRAATLAGELAHHDVTVFPLEDLTTMIDMAPVPDAVVLDVLDTTADLIGRLRRVGVRIVVTLEDRGSGAICADATINEMYADRWDPPHLAPRMHLCGPSWAVLRPEFVGHAPPRVSRGTSPPMIRTVVVTFGGTDPANHTAAALDVLAGLDDARGWQVRVIVPPARPGWSAAIPAGLNATVVTAPVMAEEFRHADVVVTAAGRTVHEAAACGAAVVAWPANERERSHDVCPGVIYVYDTTSLEAALEDLCDYDRRIHAAAAAHAAVDGLGAQRIAWLVDGLVGGMLP